MVRPRLCRRVFAEPDTTYFKPRGVPLSDLTESAITIDEFEAVRLKDLESLEQEECAKKMNISQPTFHRLIISARKKIADAIVNGKAIKIEGGNFEMISPVKRRRFGGPAVSCICQRCGHRQFKQRGIPCSGNKCPNCGSFMVRGD